MADLRHFGLVLALVSALQIGCGNTDPYAAHGVMLCDYTGEEFHRDVYIDEAFVGTDEAYYIEEGLRMWESQTDGVVRYRVVGSFKHSEISSVPNNSGSPSIYVYRVISTQPIVNVVPFALGATQNHSIVLFEDNLHTEPAWIGVTAHEVGHTLGLVHSQNASDLMALHCGPRCADPFITQGDMDQLCRVITSR